MKSPVFIFSLPRSGSTLLQRMLMAHREIASTAEPWLLLPFCYALNRNGTLTEYAHNVSATALKDFVNNLPDREDDYYEALGHFAHTLYGKQCTNNETYFLDKTPRYYYIIPQIAKIFPNAKFIFLFRNPIHVMSSMIQTWGDGGFKKMYQFEGDLNYGPKALSEGYELLKNEAYALQYEEYVVDPGKYMSEICEYLEIDFNENILSNFSFQDTKGRMGDPSGVKEYKKVEVKSLEKWKNSFNTRFRKKHITQYIKGIENNVLEIQGYNKQAILNEIESLEASNIRFLRDRFELTYSDLVKYLKPNIWLGKSTRRWARNRFLS